MTPFRIVIMVICVILAALALMVFSGVLPGFRAKTIGTAGKVVFWGTLHDNELGSFFVDLNYKYSSQFHIDYVQKDPQTIETELVDALARGQGPDIVLLPHEATLHQEDKFLLIPYQNIPESFFDQTFIPEASLLKRPTGVLGVPWYVDPIVMYYNDVILTASGVAAPPKTWVEVQSNLATSLLKRVTQTDNRKNILQSAIALGQFDNINHAKDILALLIMQAGDQIVMGLPGTLAPSFDVGAIAALNFFVQFSDPVKEQYTWNSALPNAIDQFAAGKLAIYLGTASDLAKLRQLNPHLEPGVAVVPRGDVRFNQTFGRLYVLSITKASLRQPAALAAVNVLTSSEWTKTIANQVGLPPARRDLIAAGAADDRYMTVFHQAALMSRAWFDTNPESSTEIFRRMVKSVLSGTEVTSEAVKRASEELVLDK